MSLDELQEFVRSTSSRESLLEGFLVIPGYLIVVMSGWKRAGEVLPAIVACGVSFAGMQFFVSNFMGPELTLFSLAPGQEVRGQARDQQC